MGQQVCNNNNDFSTVRLQRPTGILARVTSTRYSKACGNVHNLFLFQSHKIGNHILLDIFEMIPIN